MEKYYFLERKNKKEGPYRLEEIIKQCIYSDDLVWRSDDDSWKKASEFEEFQNIFTQKPPLTPKEEKNRLSEKHFYTSILPYSILIYVIASLFLSIISFSIANKDWQDEKDKYIINSSEVGKSYINNEQVKENSEKIKDLRAEFSDANQILNGSKKNTGEKTTLRDLVYKIEFLRSEIHRLETDSAWHQFLKESRDLPLKIEPIYNIPLNIVSSEELYSRSQNYILRPFYAFFSKIYLTRTEQENSGRLFVNILESSFLSLFSAPCMANNLTVKVRYGGM